MCGGQDGNTHTDINALQHSVEVAVLGDTLFGNIQIAHDLDTGNDGVMQRLFQRQIADHLSVDTHTHLGEILERLNVDIAGVGTVATHQQRVYQLDDRHIVVRIVCGELRHFNILGGNIRFFRRLLGADLGVVIFDCLLDPLFLTQQHLQRHIHDLADILLGIKVQRIGHCQLQFPVIFRQRNDIILLCQLFRDLRHHIHIDFVLFQIHHLKIQLFPQRLQNLGLCDKAHFFQQCAKPHLFAGLRFLELQRLVDLFLRDIAVFLQHFADW